MKLTRRELIRGLLAAPVAAALPAPEPEIPADLLASDFYEWEFYHRVIGNSYALVERSGREPVSLIETNAGTVPTLFKRALERRIVRGDREPASWLSVVFDEPHQE